MSRTLSFRVPEASVAELDGLGAIIGRPRAVVARIAFSRGLDQLRGEIEAEEEAYRELVAKFRDPLDLPAKKEREGDEKEREGDD